MPGTFEALGQGIRRSVSDVGEAITKSGQDAGPPSPAAAPWEWSDIAHPIGQAVPKLAYRLGESSPTVATGIAGGFAGETVGGPWGGVIGGGLGAAVGSAVQTLGPAYAAELKRTPNDQQGAWDRAFKQSMASGAFSGIGWSLFPLKFFNGPVRNAVFQIFAQPAVAAAHQATSNVIEGQPLSQNLGEATAEGVSGLAVPAIGRGTAALGHRAITGQWPGAGPTPVEPPTREMLETSAEHKFDTLHSDPTVYDDQLATDLRDNFRAAARAKGLDPRDQPRVFAAMDNLKAPPGPMTKAPPIQFSDLHNLRQRLGGYLTSNDPRTQFAAGLARSQLDDILMDPAKLKQYAPSMTDDQAQTTALSMRHALDEYAQAKIVEQLEALGERADNARNYTTSLQGSFRTILNSPRQRTQFAAYPGLLDAIQGYVRDEPGAFARIIDRMAEFSPISGGGAVHSGVGIELLHSLGLGTPFAAMLPIAGLDGDALKRVQGRAVSEETLGQRALDAAINAARWGRSGAPPVPPLARPWRPQIGTTPNYVPRPLPGMPPRVQQQLQNRGGPVRKQALKHARKEQRSVH
jgi:hypothetical protein